jgi:GLPGLI family protein
MKYLKIITIVTLLIGTSPISAQSKLYGTVHYESSISQKAKDDYSKKRDSLIKQKKGEFMVKNMDAVFFNTKPIVSKIAFNNGEGLYTVEQDLSIDESDIGQNIARTNSGGTNEYYYDTVKNIYLIKNCTIGECFIYPNPNLEWELTQESKQVNGYEVYKATRNNGKVTAWYAPELPLNFGPKGEYGLPGLILELELGKTIFKATKIELNPKKEVKVKKPTKGKVVTLEEYTKIMKKARQSIFGKE